MRGTEVAWVQHPICHAVTFGFGQNFIKPSCICLVSAVQVPPKDAWTS